MFVVQDCKVPKTIKWGVEGIFFIRITTFLLILATTGGSSAGPVTQKVCDIATSIVILFFIAIVSKIILRNHRSVWWTSDYKSSSTTRYRYLRSKMLLCFAKMGDAGRWMRQLSFDVNNLTRCKALLSCVLVNIADLGARRDEIYQDNQADHKLSLDEPPRSFSMDRRLDVPFECEYLMSKSE
jgi:hypothetical protein